MAEIMEEVDVRNRVKPIYEGGEKCINYKVTLHVPDLRAVLLLNI